MKNKVISLLLAILLLLTSIPTAKAWGLDREEAQEIPYTIIEENGQRYRVFELPPIVAEETMDIRDDDLLPMAEGDLISYTVKLDWSTYDLPIPDEGIEFQLCEKDSKEVVATVVATENKKKYNFIDNGKYNPSVKEYFLQVPDSIQFDIRLKQAPGSDSPNDLTFTVAQTTMSVYTAEWHDIDSAKRPKLDAKFYNIFEESSMFPLPKDERFYSVIKPGERVNKFYYNGILNPIVAEGYNTGTFSKDDLGLTAGQATTDKIDRIKGVIDNNGVEQVEGKLEATSSSPAYFFKVFGDHKTLWRYAMWEVLTVQFKSGEKGKFDKGANDETTPVEIGYDEKVAGNESGRTVDVPTATPLDPEHYEFAGWKVIEGEGADPNKVLTTEEFNAYQFKANTVFEAAYKAKDGALINVTVTTNPENAAIATVEAENVLKDIEQPTTWAKIKADALAKVTVVDTNYGIADWTIPGTNPGEKISLTDTTEFTKDVTVTAELKEKVKDNVDDEERKYYVEVIFNSDETEADQNAGNFGEEEGAEINDYTFYILKGVEWQDSAVKAKLKPLAVNDGFAFTNWGANPELADDMKDTTAPAGLTRGLPIPTAKAGENFGTLGDASTVTFTAFYEQTEKILYVTGGPAEGIANSADLPLKLEVAADVDNWTAEVKKAAAAKLQLVDGYAIYKWTEKTVDGDTIEDGVEIYNGETVYAHVKKKATTEEPVTPGDKEAYVKVTFKSDADEASQNAGNFGTDGEEYSFWILKGTAWSDGSVQALVKTLVITDEKAYTFKEWTAEPALEAEKAVTTNGKTKGLPIDEAVAGTDFGQTTTKEVVFTATYTEEEVIEGTDPDDPLRPGYTRVEFFADDVVKKDPDAEAKKGTLKSNAPESANTAVKYLYYDIKEGLKFEKVPVPTITAKTGYTVKATGKEWKPVLPANTDVVKDLTEKQFVGQYESANVIPYEPTDPKDPTNPNDKNIPTEDEDGNTIDKDEYVIIGYKVEKDEDGDLKYTIKGTEKTGKAVSYLIKKDTLWSAQEVQDTVPTPVALKTDTPFHKWDPALPATDKAVVDQSVFVAKFLKEVIEGEDPNTDVPEGYTRFKFFAEKAVKDDPNATPTKGTLTSTLDSTKTDKKYLHYDVKNVVTEGGVDKTSTFAKVPVPTIVPIDPNKVKAEPKNWDPVLPAETTEVTAGSIAKEFVAQYESATVIPYEPKDPDKPADPEDPNIPKEDEDGNKVDKDEYVIIGYKVDNKEEGDLKYTIKGEEKTGKAVSYLIKKGTKWSAPEVQGTKPEPVALKADAPFYKWDPALRTTDEAVVDQSVFVAKFKGKIIEGEDPKDPVPEGYTRVEFFAEKAVKDDPNATPTKGTLTSTMDPTKTDKKYLYYDVKNGELFSTIPVPTIVAKAGSKVKAEPKNWGPILPTKEDPARDPKVEDLTDDEKAYVGQYDTGNVIPYEPTDPENPTDPDDTNIPKEDEDGNPVDKDEYWIIGFNTDGNGQLKYTIKGEEKAGKAVSYLVKKVDDEGNAIKWNDALIQGLYPTEFEPNPGFSFVKWEPKLKNEDVEIAAADEKIATANFKQTVKEGDDPTAPIDEGYVRVAFWADKDRTGTERGTLDSTFAGSTKKGVVYLHYDVLENKEFSVVPVPTQTAKTGYALKDAPANWNPELYADNFKLVVKTDDPKKLYTFDSAYKVAGKVVPYVPADPNNPTNDKDDNIPKEDDNGNPINVDDYVIIAYKTDGNGMLKLKSTDSKWEEAIAYLIKKGTAWQDSDVASTKPTEENGRMKANEGYSFKVWTPNPDDSFALKENVEEAGDKLFEASFVKAYFPYEPTDPENPTDPDDKNIPTEDEDGNTIDKNEYNIITAFVAEANGMLLDKDQANKPVKAVSWLVHKNAKWENLQSRIPGTQPDTDYRFAGWNPSIPGQGAVVNERVYHANFEDDSAWKEPYYPDPRPSTPVIDKPAPRPDWPVIDEEEEEENVELHELYILGMTDGTFAPTKNITRAEVAMIFARIMAGRTKFDKVDTIYPDVKADHWASGAIAYTTQMGIFEGRPDGTFGPQVNITRAEYATIVARYKGILSGTPRFSDVAGHWAENYIYACGDTGIVTGYTDGTFKPNNPIIRAEAVAMTNRMLNRKGDISFILTHLTPDMIFPDVDSSYWAFDHIYEASLTHEYIRNEDESETWIRILESGRVVQ